MLEGFAVGIFNKRGAYLKSLTDGGQQERELAAKYDAWTQACQIEWPRTAKVLDRIARRYEEQARREDEVALGRL